MISTVGLISEGQEGQQAPSQDVSESTGQSQPKLFFSWPPSTLKIKLQSREIPPIMASPGKMEITHTGYDGPRPGFAVTGMGDPGQDMTTKP